MAFKNSSKYCYDNGVLINCYDIHNLDLLHKVERNITTYRISQLESGKVLFNDFFNPNNYLKLHQFLFADIYPFAGEIRDEAIHKSNAPYGEGKTLFCYPSFIYQNLSYYLAEMKNNVRKIKSRDLLLDFLAYYYGELNVVHPFREGNGRTLRTFMKLLVENLNSYLPIEDVEINYALWDDDDRDELLKATIISNKKGDSSQIKACFDKVLVFKEEELKKHHQR